MAVADATKDQQLQQVLVEMVVLVAAVSVPMVTIHQHLEVLLAVVKEETLELLKVRLELLELVVEDF